MMDSTEKIAQVDLAQMKIIHYGDPRLTERATPIEQIDQSVRALAQRMFQIMFAAGGVGLAAPQVGVTVRIFVASPTVSPDDRRVYVNPRIVSADGSQQFDEGCLSVPGVTGKIKRFHTI
ncbi:MAG: peptide deformylase, partial [Phycisphaerae bacterium]|nr:peptide deformylase [Phycisphaerae bacterium]